MLRLPETCKNLRQRALGQGRPARATGKDWGRGRAERFCHLGTSPLP